MSADEAEAAAVLRMGDPQVLGKELNQAHNSLIGRLWLLVTFILIWTSIVAVPFGAMKLHDEIRAWWKYKPVSDAIEEMAEDIILCHMECDEFLMLDGYTIQFTKAYLWPYQEEYDTDETHDGYILCLFFEHEGEAGENIYNYMESASFRDRTFLDENGEPYAKTGGIRTYPYLIVSGNRYDREKYVRCWIPDLTCDAMYIDFDVFGQKAKTKVDLGPIFKEMREKEAPL